jgi:copper resistance protein B
MHLSLRFGGSLLAVLIGDAVRAAELDVAGHQIPTFHMIRIEADYAHRDQGLWTWDLNGWIGGDIDRVWLRSEGESRDGDLDEAEAQIYFGRNFAAFWDGLIGFRQDFVAKGRSYLAGSIVGLAPYFFETEASVFLSTKGEASARFKQSFDLLLTQRAIIEPYVEVNAFAKDVPDLNVGAGLGSIEAGLQLRYEIVRQFAPYVDFVWSRKLGRTLGRVRAAGEAPEETAVRFGLRSWF